MNKSDGLMVYLAFDGDRIGFRVGQARLNDDVEALSRISQAINAGNEIWASYALRYFGTVIESGGDEGLLCVPVEALKDLEQTRLTYETCVKATVSVGVGKTISQASKALLVAKLRGRNRSVMYDQHVETEFQEASKEKDERSKIIEEYLNKAVDEGEGAPKKPEPPHKTGLSPHQFTERKQPKKNIPKLVKPVNPAKPDQKALGFDLKALETDFRTHADQNEIRDNAAKTRQSQDFRQLKDQIAQALQQFNEQLPTLADFKQSNPEGYNSVLSLVQGLIGLGRQINEADQQLMKAESKPKRYWIGAGIKIPAHGTEARRKWNDNYRQVAANHFTDGKAHLLKPVKVDPKELKPNHALIGGEDRTQLYDRMVRGGDQLPPLILAKEGDSYRVLDGHHKHSVALQNGLDTMDAYEILGKAEPVIPNTGGAMAFVNQPGEILKTDLLPGGIADHLRPEDFDPEALAMGIQVEFEHTNDIDLAREIAMDHLAEDPDYYKKLAEMESKG